MDDTGAPLIWESPECPYAVEWTDGIVESIRHSAAAAFFSIPKGGLETGGILAGSFEGGRLVVRRILPLPCRHASGPAFTLSEDDHGDLAALLKRLRRGDPEQQPVGWYRAHNGEEIALSESDRQLHVRHFPEPWQAALIVRPHVYQPMRAAFFFRQPGGEFAIGPPRYGEFVLPSKPAPPPVRVNYAHAGGAARQAPRDSLTRQIAAVLLALCCGAAAGAGAWLLRERMPTSATAAARPFTLHLTAFEAAGGLQIRWDAVALRSARGGVLRIMEDGQPVTIVLDSAALAVGGFTYGRSAEKVDIALAVQREDGSAYSESATFLGRAPR